MSKDFSDLPPAPWLIEDLGDWSPRTPAPTANPPPAISKWGVPDAPWFTESKEPAQPGYFRTAAPNGAPVYAADTPEMRAMFSTPPPPIPAPQQQPSFWANTGTAVARMPAAVASLPHTLADLYTGLTGDRSGIAGLAANYTPTEPEATNTVFKDLNYLTGGNLKPYQPQTGIGRIYQNTLAGAPLAAVGGGGTAGLLARETANLGGNTGGEVAHDLFPESPSIQTAGTLFGAILGGGIPSVAKGTADVGGKLFNTENAVNRAADRGLVAGAEADRPGLIAAINNGLPTWQFGQGELQPRPNLGTMTQDPGIQGMVYRDAAAADQAGNPVYRANDLTTNQAQREAIGAITPNIQPQLTQAQSDLTAATSGLPIGVTAQEAGGNFRQGLQGVYDQRFQARRDLGNSVFDVLDTSPAQITFQPIMDYATQQAAQNAGEVGKAYSAALGQFKSGTGITLDTAPFANSVLKGLGDLAESYPKGSAAQRAVLDIKTRAEQAVFDQEPAVGQARTAWENASKPLDVFNPRTTPGPIANAVETTRFGGYVTPNDSVVSQFLRSSGGPDAIDKLNGVFGDVKSATQPLQDYLASQVRTYALNPDGSVNLNKLQTITGQYDPVLSKLPFAGLKQQFSTIAGAQKAVDQLAARQNLYENFTNGLNSTMQVDRGGNFIYSPRRFNDFVTENQGQLVSAFGQDGANRIKQINQQLTDMAQNAYVRRPGQSGTPQALANKSGNVLTNLFAYESGSEAFADILGYYAGGVEKILGTGAVGRLAGLGIANRIQGFNTAVEEVTRNALTDPLFAKALLEKYNPKLPSAAGSRAMNYVTGAIMPGMGIDPIYKRAMPIPGSNSAAGIAAPLVVQQGQQ